MMLKHLSSRMLCISSQLYLLTKSHLEKASVGKVFDYVRYANNSVGYVLKAEKNKG